MLLFGCPKCTVWLSSFVPLTAYIRCQLHFHLSLALSFSLFSWHVSLCVRYAWPIISYKSIFQRWFVFSPVCLMPNRINITTCQMVECSQGAGNDCGVYACVFFLAFALFAKCIVFVVDVFGFPSQVKCWLTATQSMLTHSLFFSHTYHNIYLRLFVLMLFSRRAHILSGPCIATVCLYRVFSSRLLCTCRFYNWAVSHKFCS